MPRNTLETIVAYGWCPVEKLERRRKQVIGDLLRYASKAWRPALTKWHSELKLKRDYLNPQECPVQCRAGRFRFTLYCN
jgi:hypothetical protein